MRTISIGNNTGVLVPVEGAISSQVTTLSLARIAMNDATRVISTAGLRTVGSLGPVMAFSVPAHVRQIRLLDQPYTVPMPELIFVWHSLGTREHHFRVFVRSSLDPDYKYLVPFHVANVFAEGNICFGAFRASTSPMEQIATFLDSPFNHDLDLRPVFIAPSGWQKLNRPAGGWHAGKDAFFREWSQLALEDVTAFTLPDRGRSLADYMLTVLCHGTDTSSNSLIRLEGVTYLALHKEALAWFKSTDQPVETGKVLAVCRNQTPFHFPLDIGEEGHLSVVTGKDPIPFRNQPGLLTAEGSKVLALTGKTDTVEALETYRSLVQQLRSKQVGETFDPENVSAHTKLADSIKAYWHQQEAAAILELEPFLDQPLRVYPFGDADTDGQIRRSCINLLACFTEGSTSMLEPLSHDMTISSLDESLGLYTVLMTITDETGRHDAGYVCTALLALHLLKRAQALALLPTDASVVARLYGDLVFPFYQESARRIPLRHDQQMMIISLQKVGCEQLYHVQSEADRWVFTSPSQRFSFPKTHQLLISSGRSCPNEWSFDNMLLRKTPYPDTYVTVLDNLRPARACWLLGKRAYAADVVYLKVRQPFSFRKQILPTGTQLAIRQGVGSLEERTYQIVGFPEGLDPDVHNRLEKARKSGKTFRFRYSNTSPFIDEQHVALDRLESLNRQFLQSLISRSSQRSTLGELEQTLAPLGLAEAVEACCKEDPTLQYARDQIKALEAWTACASAAS